MVYTITVRIPIDAYNKCGIDRDKFLEHIKKNADKYFKQEVEIDVVKGIATADNKDSKKVCSLPDEDICDGDSHYDSGLHFLGRCPNRKPSSES